MKNKEKNIIVGVPSKSETKKDLDYERNVFEGILERVVSEMDSNKGSFIKKKASEFEEDVAAAMTKMAEGTIFEGGIKLVSGHSFPDIDAGRSFGVEVKTTKSNKWTSTGNSIFEGCRIGDIKYIYVFFGKLNKEPEFKYRRYEECICNVAITHSPRYMIDMETELGESFFDVIKCDYDEYRSDDKLQMEKLREFYREKNSSSRMWWMPPDEASLTDVEEEAFSMETVFWSSLPPEEKSEVRIECMAKFPSVFGVAGSKYEQVAFYLVKEKNIINNSLRDLFSASGKGERCVLGEKYKNIPRVFLYLLDDTKSVLELVSKGYKGSVGVPALAAWMKDFLTESKNTLDSDNTCELTIGVLKSYLDNEIKSIVE